MVGAPSPLSLGAAPRGRRGNRLALRPGPTASIGGALKLGDFKLSFSIQAPDILETRWRRDPDPAGGELVASGSFRVDLARLLEKLRDRQLGDARACLLPIFRCAAASGATEFDARCGRAGLDIRFDGRPFTAAQLRDPFSALAVGEGEEGAEDGPRARQLAYGLLGLERLGVCGVQVTSGGPSGQASVILAQPGVDPGYIEVNRAEGTLLKALWGRWRVYRAGRAAIDRLRDAYGLSRTSLGLDGRLVAANPAAEEQGWYPFDAGPWRGAFRFLPEEEPSRVRLYWLGTFIEQLSPKLPGPSVSALLAGDDLSLDLSLAQVVRDIRLQEGLEVLASHVARRQPPPSKSAALDL